MRRRWCVHTEQKMAVTGLWNTVTAIYRLGRVVNGSSFSYKESIMRGSPTFNLARSLLLQSPYLSFVWDTQPQVMPVKLGLTMQIVRQKRRVVSRLVNGNNWVSNCPRHQVTLFDGDMRRSSISAQGAAETLLRNPVCSTPQWDLALDWDLETLSC